MLDAAWAVVSSSEGEARAMLLEFTERATNIRSAEHTMLEFYGQVRS